MDEQLSIFDFPEFCPEYAPIENMSTDEAAQILNENCGTSFKKSDFVFDDGAEMYKCKKNKLNLAIYFGRFIGGQYIGQRFLSLDIENPNQKGHYVGVGYCEISINEAINHLNKALTSGKI